MSTIDPRAQAPKGKSGATRRYRWLDDMASCGGTGEFSSSPRLTDSRRANNINVQELTEVLGPNAVQLVMPTFKVICHQYPRWRLTFRSRQPEVIRVVEAAQAFLSTWDVLPEESRLDLWNPLVSGTTTANLRSFVRAFLLPSTRRGRSRGRSINWPRRTLIKQVAAVLREARVPLETKHGGNLDRTVKVLLNAGGDVTHASLDLRRDLADAVGELSAESDPVVVAKASRHIRAILRRRRARK